MGTQGVSQEERIRFLWEGLGVVLDFQSEPVGAQVDEPRELDLARQSSEAGVARLSSRLERLATFESSWW